MSETIPPVLIDLKCLKPDSLISIEIPTDMYYRIQNLLMVGIPFSNVESMRKVLSTIKNSNEDPDPATYHTRTLIWLLAQIEEAAEKQGKIETKQVDKSTGKPVV